MKTIEKKCQLILPVPILTVQYEDFENINERILNEIYAVDWDKYHEEKGIHYDAGHTKAEDTFITLDLVPSCEPILDAFIETCNEFSEYLTWDIDPAETKLNGFWAHLTRPGECTAPHTHISRHNPNHWSGTYYVNAPPACGGIRFTDDRLVRCYEPAIREPGKVYSLGQTIEAKEGLMVVFPSWLTHRVGINRSNQTRVSLSFNASLFPTPTEGRRTS